MANDDQEIMIIIFLVTLFKIMNKDCCVGKLGGGGGRYPDIICSYKLSL